MAEKNSKRPTDSELEILQVLWSLGPSTVREIFEYLSKSREIGYTTVLKIMQIMTEKGTLKRDESVRPQIYKVTKPQQQTQRQLVGHLLEKAFAGSAGSLVMQALSSGNASTEELKQIRELIDRLEGGSA